MSISSQKILASFLSFDISSSTPLTMTPPFLSVGLSTFSTFSLGVTSIPRSSSFINSIGFFFALMMFCTLANLGVLSLKSQVKTAGNEIFIFYRPKSTSLVTIKLFPSSVYSIFELNVAEGSPKIDARIGPVWLNSSSIDYFPMSTRSKFLSLKIFAKIFATARGCKSRSVLMSV